MANCPGKVGMGGLGLRVLNPTPQMNHSLNSLKGVDIGNYIGTIIWGTKGDTRSLDHSSNSVYPKRPPLSFKGSQLETTSGNEAYPLRHTLNFLRYGSGACTLDPKQCF